MVGIVGVPEFQPPLPAGNIVIFVPWSSLFIVISGQMPLLLLPDGLLQTETAPAKVY